MEVIVAKISHVSIDDNEGTLVTKERNKKCDKKE